jgi:FAD-dependent oxidoreductase domain-containing protein 1
VAVSAGSVVIVGGAIVGSCVAYFLRALGFSGPITVVERDPSYQYSSTALSAASIRTQFGTPVNIRMSLFGAKFIRTLKQRFGSSADIGFIERGYLILGGPGTEVARRRAAAMQNAEGAEIVVLTPSETRARYPWLNVDGVQVATTAQRNEGCSMPGRCCLWFAAQLAIRG